MDACRYGECVAACRDVLEVWERHLGASRAETVASVLGRRLGWLAGDARLKFIDGLWKTARDITNATHHPPTSAATMALAQRDADLVLWVVTLLSGYLSGALGS